MPTEEGLSRGRWFAEKVRSTLADPKTGRGVFPRGGVRGGRVAAPPERISEMRHIESRNECGKGFRKVVGEAWQGRLGNPFKRAVKFSHLNSKAARNGVPTERPSCAHNATGRKTHILPLNAGRGASIAVHRHVNLRYIESSMAATYKPIVLHQNLKRFSCSQAGNGREVSIRGLAEGI